MKITKDGILTVELINTIYEKTADKYGQDVDVEILSVERETFGGLEISNCYYASVVVMNPNIGFKTEDYIHVVLGNESKTLDKTTEQLLSVKENPDMFRYNGDNIITYNDNWEMYYITASPIEHIDCTFTITQPFDDKDDNYDRAMSIL